MRKILLLAASLLVATAQADAPRQMDLAYDLYHNGLKLGEVVDSFTRNGSHYTLVSEIRATGPLKMVWPGNIRLESTGDVTPEGLRPTRFQHARSDAPHKLATARLDWRQGSVAYQYRGESWQVDGLQSGAQDQLSQLYHFMFASSLPGEYRLQVVSGRKLNDYHYVRHDGGAIATPLGDLTTQRYQRVTEKPDDKAISVWLAPGHSNLPVQIRVREDGVTVEQRLVRVSVRS
jgi:hypothetical protein